MSGQPIHAVRQQAISLIGDALGLAARQDGLALPRSEAQVHKAIDLLRSEGGDGALLAAAETLSCQMREMAQLLREGRVNAYDSRALRVRKLFEACDAGASAIDPNLEARGPRAAAHAGLDQG